MQFNAIVWAEKKNIFLVTFYLLEILNIVTDVLH